MTSNSPLPLPSSWYQHLKEEFNKDYMRELSQFLKNELKYHRIFPAMSEIFNAYKLTLFNEVKVIILGQDPYHGKGQAHGLSFSVKKGIPPPPSLENIFKEVRSNFKLLNKFTTGDLTPWAKQGVFLLNSILSVREKQPASHQSKGWEIFTDATISLLNKKRENLVFLLWGKFAQSKISLIDEKKHIVLKATHPSPFSAHISFLGCQHFLKTNKFLVSRQRKPINWLIQ